MTDDISMQALTGSLGVRSAAAISAGCDVVLHCNGVKLEMAEVAAAAGPLGAAAQTRAAAALAARTAPQPVDIKAAAPATSAVRFLATFPRWFEFCFAIV